MKKLITLFIGITFCVALLGQTTKKITALPEATEATDGSITFIRSGASGDTIKRITIDNLIGTASALELSILDGGLLTVEELNRLVNIRGSVQTQLDSMVNNYGTAWRVLYRNTTGLITELALGADGTYLKSNGASAAPTFDTPAGSGDVLKSDSTVVFATPTQVDVKINSRLQEKEDSGSVGINYTDTAFFYTYISGSGEPGDSVLFAKGKKHFGVFKVKIDTCVAVSVDIIGMSVGDSCRFNLYYGNYMTGVATDSLFSTVQGAGTTRRTLTTTAKKIPPSADVWLGLKADQITGKRPKELALQFNFSKIATVY